MSLCVCVCVLKQLYNSNVSLGRNAPFNFNIQLWQWNMQKYANLNFVNRFGVPRDVVDKNGSGNSEIAKTRKTVRACSHFEQVSVSARRGIVMMTRV